MLRLLVVAIIVLFSKVSFGGTPPEFVPDIVASDIDGNKITVNFRLTESNLAGLAATYRERSDGNGVVGMSSGLGVSVKFGSGYQTNLTLINKDGVEAIIESVYEHQFAQFIKVRSLNDSPFDDTVLYNLLDSVIEYPSNESDKHTALIRHAQMLPAGYIFSLEFIFDELIPENVDIGIEFDLRRNPEINLPLKSTSLPVTADDAKYYFFDELSVMKDWLNVAGLAKGGLNIASRSLSRQGIFEEAVLLIADPGEHLIALAFERFEDGVDDQYFIVDSFPLDSNSSSISSWCWENNAFYSSANCFAVTKSNDVTAADVYPLLVDDVYYNTRFLKIEPDYPIDSGGSSQCPDGAECFTDGDATHIIHPTDYRCSNNLCWSPSEHPTAGYGEMNCYDASYHFKIRNGDINDIIEENLNKYEMCAEVYNSGEVEEDDTHHPDPETIIDPGQPGSGGENDMKIETVNMSKGSKSTRHSTLHQDPGEKFYAYAKLDNDGSATAEDFKLKFYIDGGSKSFDRDDEDYQDSIRIDEYRPDAEIRYALELTSPDIPGEYYVYACITSLDDDEDEDNNCSGEGDREEYGKLIVDEPYTQPDVHMISVSMAKGENSTRERVLHQDPGEKFFAFAKIGNSGTRGVSNCKIKFYLSDVRVFDGDDSDFEGSLWVDNLSIGDEIRFSEEITSPNDPGTYWLYAVITDVFDDLNPANDNSKEYIAEHYGELIVDNPFTQPEPELIITSPQKDEKWESTDKQTIRWISSNMSEDEEIIIEYSCDGGDSWREIYDGHTTNDGKKYWKMYNDPTKDDRDGKLRIRRASDGEVLAVSPDFFIDRKRGTPEW